MKNPQNIDLTRLGNTSDNVRAMLIELEGDKIEQNSAPQWPTRFITYQKLAPARDNGENR